MSHEPGISFVHMFNLVYDNNFVREDFPDRLLIGIFWEESLFNNIFQMGTGTGVGFGQVEPAEFRRMSEYDLPPPPIRKIGSKTAAARPLSDDESVQVACALLGSLRDRLGTRRAALLGYAGYWWAKSNPGGYPSASQRLGIVAGWEACERKLQDIRPFREPERGEQDTIMAGLNLARPFWARREAFRPILFQSDDYQ